MSRVMRTGVSATLQRRSNPTVTDGVFMTLIRAETSTRRNYSNSRDLPPIKRCGHSEDSGTCMSLCFDTQRGTELGRTFRKLKRTEANQNVKVRPARPEFDQ